MTARLGAPTVGGQGTTGSSPRGTPVDRKQLDILIPMLFGLAVLVAALFFDDAVFPVAVVGGILLGIYYAVLRSRMVGAEGGRRQRNRYR